MDMAPNRKSRKPIPWGRVRASPYGAGLQVRHDNDGDGDSNDSFTQWRGEHLPPQHFPREGFDHVYGSKVVEAIDNHDLGAEDDHEDDDDAQKARTAATNRSTTTTSAPKKQHDYGSRVTTPDDAPVGALRDKWRLLPYFLKLRSLLSQHISSFDHFVNIELSQIIRSPSNREIRSEHDAKFFLRYEHVWLGPPSVPEDSYTQDATVTPLDCRARDCTYSAPILVNIRYTRGQHVVLKKGVCIGRMPIMLRSQHCLLYGKNYDELAALKECPYDPGGYFIVKGVEKVILIQEQLSKNRVILETDSTTSSSSGGKKVNNIMASITSSTHERKSKAYVLVKHGKVYLKNNTLGDDIPIAVVFKAMGLESDMEMVQLMVGGSGGSGENSTSCDPELVNALALSLEEPTKLGISTTTQALRYIGGKIRGKNRPNGGGFNNYSNNNSRSNKQPLSLETEAREVLANVVLSHVPVDHFDFRRKAIYIGHVVRRVLLVQLGKLPLDDKDYYGNKRLELAGNLLSLLFEDLFKLLNKDLKRQVDLVLSKPNRAQAFDVIKVIRQDTITYGMVTAISTGNWVLKRFRMDRAGVTQVLSRLSYMSALGMMTRINSQFEKTRKVSGPRSLQPSQWGMLCPADTPEGEACGLVKNLALLGHITTDSPSLEPIMRILMDLGVEDVARLSGNELSCGGDSKSGGEFKVASHLVFLNGLLQGVTVDPQKLVRDLRTLRRRGQVGEFVSVYGNEAQRAVHIATDGGRVCRPLLVVDTDTGLPLLKQWHVESLALGVLTVEDLLKQGIAEYVDCNEENNTLIAVTERDLQAAIQQGLDQQRMRYTHLEVDPFTVLGVIGGIIPFPHHNQSPRNTYTVAMAKQAMGTIGMNQYERIDGLIYTLVYPQKPMVKSRTLDLVNFDNIPGGQNSCIAVMSYSGYDIEDAVILNKAAIDRGFGRCMVLRKHQTSVRRYANGTMDRTLGPPDPSEFRDGEEDVRYERYRALDMDGICRVGEHIKSGMMMVNKQSPMDTTSRVDVTGLGLPQNAPSNMNYKPTPLSYRSSAPTYVDKVLITSNENEQFLIKIMLRQVRRPEVGDKFASRHGQKGVCGLIAPEEDLPFNEQGHCPDLIMNPHGFPSRMTVGKLLELLVGKAGVYEGRQAYSTAFGEEHSSADTAEEASEALIRNGLNYTGKDILYSGTNGEPLDAYIFSGPVFYQKLKHMVLDKAHARARGPRAVLTRQPTEGRSRDGGLRLGEMERDCLIAYGVSNLIMERLMHSSDAFSANVCMTCGLLQYEGWCQYCRSGEKVTDIRLPYACKLLFQELQSMNVLPRLRLKDK